MSEHINVDEALVQRLPLPLAKLVRRAQNAKTPLDRHQAAYYLWEAALKLLASVAVVEYAELGDHDPKLVEMLENLARPTVGHWWEFVRRLVPRPGRLRATKASPRFANWSSAASATTCPAPPGSTRPSLEHLAGQGVGPGDGAADRALRPPGRIPQPGDSATAPPASAQGAFYDRMARALFGGVAEILGRLDVLAGRRLIYVGDVRRQSVGRLAGRALRADRRVGAADRIAPGGRRPGEPPLPRSERVYIDVERAAIRAARWRRALLV